MVSVCFLCACIPQPDDAKLGKGVDITESRLPDYISVNTDPSRFGCKIWGRPSVPISSINIGTFCCLKHDRIGIHVVGFFV